MPDFTPGWYIVSPMNAEGREYLRYFAKRDLVTCECYRTNDRKEIYLWGPKERPKGVKDVWKDSYKSVPSDPNNRWDNDSLAAEGKGKGNSGQAAATGTGTGKGGTPCEDLTRYCPACDRKGLLLMPLRYAVSRAGVGGMAAPALTGNFSAGGKVVALPSSLASYTVRTSRAGYVYVFNEKLGDKGWKGYLIDNRGYLAEFDVFAAQPPAGENIDNAPCGRRPTSEMARCIPIPDAHIPGRVEKIWMTFSDTPWTQAVLKTHMTDASVRQANMRSFDGAAWCQSKGSVALQHVERLDTGYAQVAEFKLEADMLSRLLNPLGYHWPMGSSQPGPNTHPAFLDSISPFVSATGQLPRLLEAGRQAGKEIPVAMIALDDPVGIAMDLNSQIINRARSWMNQPLRRWKRESAQAIDALAMAVRHNAVQRTSETRSTVAGILGTIIPATSGGIYRGRTPAEKMAYAGHITEEEADRLGSAEWQSDHLKLYDDSAKRKYMEVDYPRELSAFEEATINPLDDAYLSWMKSEQYRNHFTHNFDVNNADSGVAYVQKLVIVINDAAGRSKVASYLAERLTDDPEKRSSVEVRALVANQERIIKEWVATSKSSAFNKAGISWAEASEKIWGVFNSVLTSKEYAAAMGGSASPQGGKWMEAAMNAVAKLAYQISGPIITRLNDMGGDSLAWLAAKLPERRLMSVLGALAHAEDPTRRLRLIDLRTETTRKQATRMVAAALAGIAGGQENQYRGGVRAALDRIEDGQGRRYPYQVIMLVDETAAQRLTQLRGNQREAHIMQSVIVKHEEFDALLRRNTQRVLNLEFKAGVVSNIFSAFSLGRAWREMRKAKADEKDVKITNFAGGVAALSGSLMELSAMAAKHTPWGGGSHGIRLRLLGGQLESKAGLLGGVGKFLGAIAGCIGGALSIIDGYQDIGLSRGYGICMIVLGLASIIAAILLFTTFAFVGLIIGLVVAVITLVVGFFKPTKVQKWLDACYFGRHKSKRFSDLADESQGLKALSEED